MVSSTLWSSFVGTRSLFLLATLAATAAAACTSDRQPAPAAGDVGTLQLALTATVNGRTYRLRHASFLLSGPTNTVVDTESNPDATSLSAVLNTGTYKLELASGWFLERQDTAGPTRVDAVLTSPNPTFFEMATGATLNVPFRFATDGIVVVVGTGTLGITPEVTETGTARRLRLLAGRLGGSGSGDGTGAVARFSNPYGITYDGAANLYVTDTFNNTIRKVVIATGEVTTIAGVAGEHGSNDGIGTAARFSFPGDVVGDGQGNLYVTDTSNDTIRKIVIATGEVTTLAGSAEQFGSADGVGAAARFGQPVGITTDGAGNLYVAEGSNNLIRKIVIATGEVTTFAGSTTSFFENDGIGTAAGFSSPQGITYDGVANLYVGDVFGSTIRKIVLDTAEVTTIAGLANISGAVDGTGADARFHDPFGLATDGLGNLYVADGFNFAIRKIVLETGEVTTFAGVLDVMGIADGVGSAARLNFPQDLVSDGMGNLYVADTNNSIIRKLTVAGAELTTIAGGASDLGGDFGLDFGNTFAGGKTAIAVGDTLYVTVPGENVIRKVSLATGESVVWAGSPMVPGSDDGIGTGARFNSPWGLATDDVGNFYVSDTSDNTIRKINILNGEVTTLAGTPGVVGAADGVGPAAQFDVPEGLACDHLGNLYVTDFFNSQIRRIDLATAEVTTIAGSPGNFNHLDGVGAAAHFQSPAAVFADDDGNLLVADGGTIRRIVVATGEVTTFAGAVDFYDRVDGVGSAAHFSFFLESLSSDGAGSLYAADLNNHAIRRIELDTARVTTVIGSRDSGVRLAPADARLNQPGSVFVLPNRDLVILDEGAVLIAGF